jgi:hypothetical protein
MIKKNVKKHLLAVKRRLYKPLDNSYATCEDGQKHYLAGTYNTRPVIVEVISEPFEKEVFSITNVMVKTTFIRVKCPKGLIHEVLYHKHAEIELW